MTMGTTTGMILDVTRLAPMEKHSTIFNRIARLQEGESLIIHNDHDPAPLRYQLAHTHQDTVAWEYLEQGPQWWKVKLTRRAPRNEKGRNILDVTQLAPHEKHATIFARIARLQGGESLTLHNDHDPVPLRYHLEAEHGDAYGWEYLEQGPAWWKVRITRRITGAGADGANELDVTKLAPREKHPTIFSRYHALKGGESLIIHNDHDPRPLYYQMQGEMGDVFTWEYLEEGPRWWRVRITKRSAGNSGERLGEMVVRDMRKADVLKRNGLDFCCHGDMTLNEACAARGIDVVRVEQELREVEKDQGRSALPYGEWEIDFLADFIVNTHHRFLRNNLQDIRTYAAKVEQVHGDSHPELHRVNDLVQALCDELTAHVEDEEKTLFPYIRQMVAARNAGRTRPASAMGPLNEKVDKLVLEHTEVGGMIDELHDVTGGYAPPADACASYTLLYRKLQELEDDTHIHIALENHLLFRKAAEMELTV